MLQIVPTVTAHNDEKDTELQVEHSSHSISHLKRSSSHSISDGQLLQGASTVAEPMAIVPQQQIMHPAALGSALSAPAVEHPTNAATSSGSHPTATLLAQAAPAVEPPGLAILQQIEAVCQGTGQPKPLQEIYRYLQEHPAFDDAALLYCCKQCHSAQTSENTKGLWSVQELGRILTSDLLKRMSVLQDQAHIQLLGPLMTASLQVSNGDDTVLTAAIAAFVRCCPSDPAAYAAPGASQCSPQLVQSVWKAMEKEDRLPTPSLLAKLGATYTNIAADSGAVGVQRGLDTLVQLHLKKVMKPGGESVRIRSHFSREAGEGMQPMLDLLADSYVTGTATDTAMIDCIAKCAKLGCLPRKLLAHLDTANSKLDIRRLTNRQRTLLYVALAELGCGFHDHEQQVLEHPCKDLMTKLTRQLQVSIGTQEEGAKRVAGGSSSAARYVNAAHRDEVEFECAKDHVDLIRAICVTNDTSSDALALLNDLLLLVKDFVPGVSKKRRPHVFDDISRDVARPGGAGDAGAAPALQERRQAGAERGEGQEPAGH